MSRWKTCVTRAMSAVPCCRSVLQESANNSRYCRNRGLGSPEMKGMRKIHPNHLARWFMGNIMFGNILPEIRLQPRSGLQDETGGYISPQTVLLSSFSLRLHVVRSLRLPGLPKRARKTIPHHPNPDGLSIGFPEIEIGGTHRWLDSAQSSQPCHRRNLKLRHSEIASREPGRSQDGDESDISFLLHKYRLSPGSGVASPGLGPRPR